MPEHLITNRMKDCVEELSVEGKDYMCMYDNVRSMESTGNMYEE